METEVVYEYVEDVDANLVRGNSWPLQPLSLRCGGPSTAHHDKHSPQTCSICRSPLVDPVTTTTCKHTFCRECITNAMTYNPSCPIDRSALTPSSLQDTETLVQLILDETLVNCSNEGCGEIMQRGLLLSHSRSCQSGLVRCADDGCGLVVSPSSEARVRGSVLCLCARGPR